MKLSLPDKMLITGSDPTQIENFVAKLKIAIKTGIKLIQLRTPGLIASDYVKLVHLAKILCESYHAQLILNPPIENIDFELTYLQNLGLHLTSRRLMLLTARPPEYKLVGASCHNLYELIHAETLALDYVVLSPVLVTATHPQAKPLGWNKFAQLIAEVNIPVYALGGMTAELIPIAKQHGACGIAAIRGLWPEFELGEVSSYFRTQTTPL